MAREHLCLVHSFSCTAWSDSSISSVKLNPLANSHQDMVHKDLECKMTADLTSFCIGKQPRYRGCGDILHQCHSCLARNGFARVLLLSARYLLRVSSSPYLSSMRRNGQPESPDRQQTSGTVRDLNNSQYHPLSEDFCLGLTTGLLEGSQGK